jgi:hypothetical protein
MQVIVVQSQHDAASRALVAALEAAGAQVTLLDAYSPADEAAVNELPVQVTHLPCVAIKHGATVVAELQHELLDVASVVAFAKGVLPAVIEVPRVNWVTGSPVQLKAVSSSSSDAAAVRVSVDGAAVAQATRTVVTPAEDPEDPPVVAHDPVSFVNGVATFDVTFAEPGTHTVTIGDFVATFEVAEAPPAPAPEE